MAQAFDETFHAESVEDYPGEIKHLNTLINMTGGMRPPAASNSTMLRTDHSKNNQ